VQGNNTRQLSWLRHATSRKLAGFITDEVIEFFSINYSFQPHYGPRVDSASNRNKYQEISWVQGRPARKADNLTPICEPIV
jgi:hypothetical protein